MFRLFSLARASSAASSFAANTVPLNTINAETSLRDLLFREMRPHQVRLDVPVLASMAADCGGPEQRMVSAGATNFQAMSMRSISFQCPHSLRRIMAIIDGKKVRVLVGADPSTVVGFTCQKKEFPERKAGESSSTCDSGQSESSLSSAIVVSEEERGINKIWDILFDQDNSATSMRELRKVIVREVVLPFMKEMVLSRCHRGAKKSDALLAVAVADLTSRSGWHRYAHMMVDFTSLQDALLESGGAALLSGGGAVVPTDPALWAEILHRRRRFQLAEEVEEIELKPRDQLWSISVNELFGGTKIKYNPAFVSESLAHLLFRSDSAFRRELRDVHGFEITEDRMRVQYSIPLRSC